MNPPAPDATIENALSVMLYEISMRMDIDTLAALNGTSIGPLLHGMKKDSLWWYRRAEYLVGRELTYNREFEWQLIYNSLSNAGIQFNSEQDYAAVGLVRVLVAISASMQYDAQYTAYFIARDASKSDFSSLISDVRFAELDLFELLPEALEAGNIPVVHYIMDRITLSEEELSDLIGNAIESQEIRLVAFLLEKGARIRARDNVWKNVIERGRFDIFQLLMQDSPPP